MQFSIKGVNMFKLLKNEKGAVLTYVVSITIALISLISSLSLTMLTYTSSLQKNYQHDMIQEDILLRSEGVRSQLSVEINPNLNIPGREVEVSNSSNRNTSYYINNTKVLTTISNFMGFATKSAIKVTSSVTAKRKKLNQSNPTNATENIFGSSDSPVVRVIERFLQNESLSKYQYFTNTEASINEDSGEESDVAVKFWGPDVLWGPLHSNNDIWIQNAGGGTNGGWPTFHSHVTTSGIFRLYPGGAPAVGNCPMDEIFRGGWTESVQQVGYEPTATKIRQNGTWLFTEDTYDFCFIDISGGSIEAFGGRLVPEVKSINTHSWYPADEDWVDFAIANDVNWFVESDTVFTSYVTVYDTIWSELSVNPGNDVSFFVPCELWIKGSIGGNQSWGASGDIRIMGDITYANSTIGDPPDGYSGIDDDGNLEYDGPVNSTDYFGLVSEQSIYVGYKTRHPLTNEIMDDNVAGGESNHVYLYGAYAAIAQGDQDLYGPMACHYDGEFSFEYQHPHGSTPSFTAASPYTGQDTLYEYVDFHKYIFPINTLIPPIIAGFNLHSAPPGPQIMISNGYPNYNPDYLNSLPNNGPNYVYPHATDYPWYNPIWPESLEFIVFERGTLHVFGSIAQTRRGFIHRSGSDDYNHPPGLNEWNMETYHYGGDHGPTGYDKDYSYDRRFLYVQPKDYPEVYNGFGDSSVTPFRAYNWSFKTPSDN